MPSPAAQDPQITQRPIASRRWDLGIRFTFLEACRRSSTLNHGIVLASRSLGFKSAALHCYAVEVVDRSGWVFREAKVAQGGRVFLCRVVHGGVPVDDRRFYLSRVASGAVAG